jgi:hypothetical protein
MPVEILRGYPVVVGICFSPSVRETEHYWARTRVGPEYLSETLYPNSLSFTVQYSTVLVLDCIQ